MTDLIRNANAHGDSSQSMLSKIQRYNWTFRKWWWVILITMSLGISWAAWTDSKKPPAYISHGRMMVSGRVALPDGATLSEEVVNFYGTQSRIMESAAVRTRAAARIENTTPELRASPVSVSVSLEKGTSFFNLTAIGEEPKYTQAFLKACMEEYNIFKREQWDDLIAQKQVLLVEAKLNEERERDAGFDQLLEFKKRHSVAALEQEGNSAAKQLVQLKARLAQKREDYQLLTLLDVEQNIERKQQSANGGTPTDTNSESSPAPTGAEVEYLKAKQAVELLKAERLRRSKVMRPKHPLMVALAADISQQEGLIQLYYDQSLAQLSNRRESLRLEIETLEASLKEMSERTLESERQLAEFDKIRTKVDQAKAQQNRLFQSYEKVELDGRLRDDVITILDQASPAEVTKAGLIKDLCIGALGGGLVGLVIVIIIGMLDDRVTSSIELRERFPEALLGHIPHEPSTDAGRVSMLTVNNKQGIFVEAYRNLRSTLHFMSLEEPRPKAFLVTSAVPGEGKSTVAVNLGIILAAGGSRTLLVDADLRKGLLHTYFKVESSPGLIDVLNGSTKWQEALVETDVKNLTLLPRGKGGVGPSEFFMLDAADQFLREIYAAGYDRIVVDSAPILATDDTACLAPKIDATLFVVRAEASSMRLTRTALDALHKRQVNVLGLILNAASLRSSEYQYYHKYGDYYSDAAQTAPTA